MSYNIVKSLEEHVKTLGIEWDIQYSHDPEGQTCRIISDEVRRQHEIILTTSAVQRLQNCFSDLMHELCHAKLSEVYSPAFSTIRFDNDTHQKLQSKSALKRKKIATRINQLHESWLHVDLWVNQLRNTHWPECTQEEAEMMNNNVPPLLRDGREHISVELAVAIAMHLVDGKRYSFDTSPVQKALESLDPKDKNLINLLDEYFVEIPNLPKEAPKALELLQESVQKVSKILKYPIQAKLIEQEGQQVWSFSGNMRNNKKKKKKR